jgi:hypothetical protein
MQEIGRLLPPFLPVPFVVDEGGTRHGSQPPNGGAWRHVKWCLAACEMK